MAIEFLFNGSVEVNRESLRLLFPIIYSNA